MTTLRRELIQKIDGVMKKYHIIYDMEEVAEIADAVLELRGFALLKNADPAWSILAGQEITEEQVKTTQLRDVAPKMFEKALGFSKRLPWWDGDKDWRELGEWVCAEYEKDKMSFGRYNIWRNTKYTKGGIANTRLRGFPKEFYDSWDMFKQSDGEQPHKTDEQKPKYDILEAAIEREKHAVPRPAGLVPNIKRGA